MLCAHSLPCRCRNWPSAPAPAPHADAALLSRAALSRSALPRLSCPALASAHTCLPAGEQSRDFCVVLATNRPSDLDPAVIDRTDDAIEFALPGPQER